MKRLIFVDKANRSWAGNTDAWDRQSFVILSNELIIITKSLPTPEKSFNGRDSRFSCYTDAVKVIFIFIALRPVLDIDSSTDDFSLTPCRPTPLFISSNFYFVMFFTALVSPFFGVIISAEARKSISPRSRQPRWQSGENKTVSFFRLSSKVEWENYENTTGKITHDR